MQIEKKKYHTWLPCVKGAVTVWHNILGIAVSIRLKMYWNRTEFFGAVTEGLLAEVMAEAERFDAGDPSIVGWARLKQQKLTFGKGTGKDARYWTPRV